MKDRKVAIFWDYENCSAPAGCSGHQVVKSIRGAIQPFGSIKSFKAYLAISEQQTQTKSLTLRSELQASGVSLTDTPHNGRKDVADKMMIVDMLLYALDNDPPATLVLISGDRDFAYAISVLRLRQYDVVLLSPPNAHPSLTSHATLCLDWNKEVLHTGYDIPTSPTVATSSLANTSRTAPSTLQNPRYDIDNLGDVSLEAYLSHQRPRSPVNGKASASQAGPPPAFAILSNHQPSSKCRWTRVDSVSSNNSFTTCNSIKHQSSDSERWTDVSHADSRTPSSPSLEPNTHSIPGAVPRENIKPQTTLLVPQSLYDNPSSPILVSPLTATMQATPPLIRTQIPGPLPHQFVTLIKILRGYRERGIVAPFRPAVAVEVLTADRSVLDILPDDSHKVFSCYAELAKQYGVVDIGGSGGDAWISLQPRYYDFEA